MSDPQADLLAEVAACIATSDLALTAALRDWLKQSADEAANHRRMWSSPRDTPRRRKRIDRMVEEKFRHPLAVARAVAAEAGIHEGEAT